MTKLIHLYLERQLSTRYYPRFREKQRMYRNRTHIGVTGKMIILIVRVRVREIAIGRSSAHRRLVTSQRSYGPILFCHFCN